MKRFRIISLLISVVMLMILPLQIFAEGESSGVSGDTTVNAETSVPADETLSEDGNAREYSADEITAKQQNTEDPQAADNELKSGTQNTDAAESVSEATVPSAVSENTQSTDAKAASVTVQLKANDEESETYSLNSENSWTYKWEELPAYDDDGNLIKYTIDEAEIPGGYTKSVEEEGDTVTITNTHTPEPTPEPTAPSEPTPTPTPTPVNPTPVPPAPVSVPPMNPDPVPAQGPAVVPLPAETPEPTATPTATASAAPTPGAVDIDDPETPLAPAYWALLNLISAIVTVLIGLGMCITMLRKSDDDDDDEDDQNGAAKQAAESDDEEEEEEPARA